jgi:hypothetical protein
MYSTFFISNPSNENELVKTQKMTSPVIPAKAGIQEKQALLDPGFRRGDGFAGFLP